jgi:hypothetical protein
VGKIGRTEHRNALYLGVDVQILKIEILGRRPGVLGVYVKIRDEFHLYIIISV